MTIIQETQTTSHTPLRDAAFSLVATVTRSWHERQNRRSIMNLADFDDHMLSDLGLSRHDVTSALSLPSSQDPSHHLSMVVASRRR